MLLLAFGLDEYGYALELDAVERVTRAVEVTPLPDASGTVLGAVNMHGRIIPVINLRNHFHLGEKEIDLDDQLIIARTADRSAALLVDCVHGIIEFPGHREIPAEGMRPAAKYAAGLIKHGDGMVLVLDLDRLLELID